MPAKVKADVKTKKVSAFNLYMKARLNDHDFFPGAGHKVRFQEAVKEWNSTAKFLPQFNPKAGALGKQKVKPPKVDLTRDTATPVKRKAKASNQPSEEKPLAGSFGCSKCRGSASGCRACNPTKAQAPRKVRGKCDSPK